MTPLARMQIALVAMLLAIVYLCTVIVRIENERYALFVGMCRDAKTGFVDGACLAKVETRTSPMWHLLYAITGG